MADSREAGRQDVEEEAAQEYSAAFDANGLNRFVQRIGSLFSAAGLPTEGHRAIAKVQDALVRMPGRMLWSGMRWPGMATRGV